MPSPFPGMDPYLEQYWGDVHTTLSVYSRNQLNKQLPDALQARVEESVSIETQRDEFRTIYPDVRVVEDGRFETGGGGGTAVAVAEPEVETEDALIVEFEKAWDEPMTERHLEVVDLSDGGRVITAIEFISPANKTGDAARQKYLQKRREYAAAGVNVVEIDLTRTGPRILSVPRLSLPKAMRTPYGVCVFRVLKPTQFEYYRASMRARLPTIKVPLRATDKDALLQLQPLIDDCYRDGRYHRIDYRVPPVPPLDPDDQEWTEKLLKEKQLR